MHSHAITSQLTFGFQFNLNQSFYSLEPYDITGFGNNIIFLTDMLPVVGWMLNSNTTWSPRA